MCCIVSLNEVSESQRSAAEGRGWGPGAKNVPIRSLLATISLTHYELLRVCQNRTSYACASAVEKDGGTEI